MELPVLTPSALEAIFLRACAEVPDWFLGVIRPGVRNSYRLHLEHHRLGAATFTFGCTAARPIRGGAIFTRSCDVVGNVAGTSDSRRESAFLFEIAVPRARLEIPEFYQSGPKIRCEIAWRLNRGWSPNAGGRLTPLPHRLYGPGSDRPKLASVSTIPRPLSRTWSATVPVQQT